MVALEEAQPMYTSGYTGPAPGSISTAGFGGLRPPNSARTKDPVPGPKISGPELWIGSSEAFSEAVCPERSRARGNNYSMQKKNGLVDVGRGLSQRRGGSCIGERAHTGELWLDHQSLGGAGGGEGATIHQRSVYKFWMWAAPTSKTSTAICCSLGPFPAGP